MNAEGKIANILAYKAHSMAENGFSTALYIGTIYWEDLEYKGWKLSEWLQVIVGHGEHKL